MILGLDFATSTGWAHGDANDPWFGTWDMSGGGSHPGRRFSELRRNLVELYRARPFDRVVAEDASFGANVKHLATMAFHNCMKRTVLLTCCDLGVPVTMVVPTKWKAWMGSGRMKKAETMRAVETLWGVTVRDANQADALCLMQYGEWLRQGGREKEPAKTKRAAKRRAKATNLFK